MTTESASLLEQLELNKKIERSYSHLGNLLLFRVHLLRGRGEERRALSSSSSSHSVVSYFHTRAITPSVSIPTAAALAVSLARRCLI